MERNDIEAVVRLEFELLDPAVRHDRERLRDLIDQCVVGFGQSGQIWHRPDLIDELVSSEPVDPPTVDELETRHITPDVILLTYRTSRADRPPAMRSSWWRRTNTTWRIVFHQATVI